MSTNSSTLEEQIRNFRENASPVLWASEKNSAATKHTMVCLAKDDDTTDQPYQITRVVTECGEHESTHPEIAVERYGSREDAQAAYDEQVAKMEDNYE